MTALSSEDRARATRAAERVLVDLGQVLASHMDRMVLVGGLSPSFLYADANPAHSGSIDVDVALQAEALSGGGYARLLAMLVETGRYRLSDDPSKRFRFLTEVDLGDGLPMIEVPVDFLASPGAKFRRDADERLVGFRVLQADGCDTAFREPKTYVLEDLPNVSGILNSVAWRIIAVEDLLVMKAYAIRGRENAKDAYDIVFCLDQLNQQNRLSRASENWRLRAEEEDVKEARRILEEKFRTVNHVGPQWYADFLAEGDRMLHLRTAHGLVQGFLEGIKM